MGRDLYLNKIFFKAVIDNGNQKCKLSVNSDNGMYNPLEEALQDVYFTII